MTILVMTEDFKVSRFQNKFSAGFAVVERETPCYYQIQDDEGTTYNVSKKTGHILHDLKTYRFTKKSGAKFEVLTWEPV